ncbi:MAG: alpha/beta fold hydrolase [Chloroflexi bacterium]|nr:alpha/beta fold hydrolase [Chloroflexota bacterium]
MDRGLRRELLDTWIRALGRRSERMEVDKDALRAHFSHEKIILFGHSYGGFLAQEYALRYQDKLAGLILCDAAPVIDYMDVMQANAGARGTAEQLATLGQAFGRPMADDADFQGVWEMIMPLYFHCFYLVLFAK